MPDTFKKGDRVRYMQHWICGGKDLFAQSGTIMGRRSSGSWDVKLDDPNLSVLTLFGSCGRYDENSCWGMDEENLEYIGHKEYTVNKLGNFPKKEVRHAKTQSAQNESAE